MILYYNDKVTKVKYKDTIYIPKAYPKEKKYFNKDILYVDNDVTNFKTALFENTYSYEYTSVEKEEIFKAVVNGCNSLTLVLNKYDNKLNSIINLMLMSNREVYIIDNYFNKDVLLKFNSINENISNNPIFQRFINEDSKLQAEREKIYNNAMYQINNFLLIDLLDENEEVINRIKMGDYKKTYILDKAENYNAYYNDYVLTNDYLYKKSEESHILKSYSSYSTDDIEDKINFINKFAYALDITPFVANNVTNYNDTRSNYKKYDGNNNYDDNLSYDLDFSENEITSFKNKAINKYKAKNMPKNEILKTYDYIKYLIDNDLLKDFINSDYVLDENGYPILKNNDIEILSLDINNNI